MARVNELRLMAKIARLYYEQDLRQAQIAARLDLSQATISRLLKRAEKEQIVRIHISAPLGAFPDLEDGLQTTYGLKDAIVVNCIDDEQILGDIGAAAAYYLETTLKQGDVIGISSWSATLLAMVNAMHMLAGQTKTEVVQILGGIGSPSVEHHATQLTRRLAMLTHAEATFLPAPGIVGAPETKQAFLQDQFVQAALARFEHVTLALVGIGDVEPSRLLASSGNVFSREELDQLRRLGAVGDICLRFFDISGSPIPTPLNHRVIGMELEQIRNVKRSVGIAGGKRKLAAIHGALTGHWINVLITDRFTAEALLAENKVRPPKATPNDHREDA